MATWRKVFIGLAAVVALGALVLILRDPDAVGMWATLVSMLCVIVSQVVAHRRSGR